MKRENIIYAVSKDGHRQSYMELLSKHLDLEPCYAKMSPKSFLKLVGARSVFFSSLDDTTIGFAAIAIIRSMLGRPTAGLFLRADKCFDNRLITRLKKYVFILLRQFQKVTAISIIPFEIAPHLEQVAKESVCDPQYWDLYEDIENDRLVSQSNLSEFVRKQANGRKILVTLGAQSEIKGLRFLLELLESQPNITKQLAVFCVGKYNECFAEEMRHLERSGVTLVPRHVSDEELYSLYMNTDFVWACYAPHYDQASGIFGRSIQFDVPAIIRQGSTLDKFATRFSLSALPIGYGAIDDLSITLTTFASKRAAPDKSADQIREWRTQFFKKVRASL